jgi:hypothetical protein
MEAFVKIAEFVYLNEKRPIVADNNYPEALKIFWKETVAFKLENTVNLFPWRKERLWLEPVDLVFKTY